MVPMSPSYFYSRLTCRVHQPYFSCKPKSWVKQKDVRQSQAFIKWWERTVFLRNLFKFPTWLEESLNSLTRCKETDAVWDWLPEGSRWWPSRGLHLWLQCWAATSFASNINWSYCSSSDRQLDSATQREGKLVLNCSPNPSSPFHLCVQRH